MFSLFSFVLLIVSCFCTTELDLVSLLNTNVALHPGEWSVLRGYSESGIGCNGDRVWLEGLIDITGCNVLYDSFVILTLPQAFTPNKTQIFTVRTTARDVRVDVRNNGDIRLTDTSTAVDWISLSGITYCTDPVV